MLGNLILTKNEFLDNGIHNFTLNGAGLQQGAYFLKITDGSNQNYIKLIKTGNTSGSNPSISYSGANNSEIVYKGMDNGSRILIYNNNIFTFTCYSKNYWTLISGEKTVTELSANNVVNFLLSSSKKYNINGGYIDISGIYYKYSNYNYYKDPYNTNTSTDTTTTNFNISYNLQNNYLTYFEEYSAFANGGDFLACNNYSSDSLVVDFCDKKFIVINESNKQFHDSKSRTVLITFDKDSNKINDLILNYYDKNYYISSNPNGGGDERIRETLELTNIPFTVDSLKNIVIDIKGRSILDFIKINFNYQNTYGSAEYITIIQKNLIKIDSVSDNAIIKIGLIQ